MRKRQKGFSLIELLIVVAIILIIAAIAIPNLLRAKMAANEASAVGSIRTINTVSVEYSTTYGGYPTSLLALGGPAGGTAAATSAELIDAVLAAGHQERIHVHLHDRCDRWRRQRHWLHPYRRSDHRRHDRTTGVLHRPVRRDPRERDRRGEHQQHADQLVKQSPHVPLGRFAAGPGISPALLI